MNFKVCFSLIESSKWEIEDIFNHEHDSFNLEHDFLPQKILKLNEIEELPVEVKRASGQILSIGYFLILEFLKEINIRFCEERVDGVENMDEDSIKFFSTIMDHSMKHQRLFRDVREAFENKTGRHIIEVGHLDEIVTPIVSKDFFGILLAQLHFALLAQKHYLAVESSRTDVNSLFLAVLKAHWTEEAHLIKLYLLYIEKLKVGLSADEVTNSLNDYILILDSVENFIKIQSKYNAEDICRITGVNLCESDRKQVKATIYSALKDLNIIQGLEHPTMQIVMDGLPVQDEEFRSMVKKKIGQSRSSKNEDLDKV